MKKHIVVAGVVCAALALVPGSVTSSRAAEVYSYVGNDYTSTYGALFSSSDFMAISFTVAAPLGDNFSGAVAPTSFTVSDGVDTITSGNSLALSNSQFPSYPSFDIVTNALGQITKWAIAVAYTNNSGYSDTIVSISGLAETNYTSLPDHPAIDIADAWNYCNLPNCGEETYAGQDYTPGVWSYDPALSATPLPAALPLFAGGLGVIGLFGRRRKRESAAALAV
jgi:hypothetical protein